MGRDGMYSTVHADADATTKASSHSLNTIQIQIQ